MQQQRKNRLKQVFIKILPAPWRKRSTKHNANEKRNVYQKKKKIRKTAKADSRQLFQWTKSQKKLELLIEELNYFIEFLSIIGKKLPIRFSKGKLILDQHIHSMYLKKVTGSIKTKFSLDFYSLNN